MQVHGLLAHSDVDCLCFSSLPVSTDTSLNHGTSPVNCVVGLMNVNSNTTLWVSSSHSLFVLPYLTLSVLFVSAMYVGLLQYLQGTSYTTALRLSLGMRVFTVITVCCMICMGLKAALTPREVHTLSTLSLRPLA